MLVSEPTPTEPVRIHVWTHSVEFTLTLFSGFHQLNFSFPETTYFSQFETSMNLTALFCISTTQFSVDIFTLD